MLSLRTTKKRCWKEEILGEGLGKEMDGFCWLNGAEGRRKLLVFLVEDEEGNAGGSHARSGVLSECQKVLKEGRLLKLYQGWVRSYAGCGFLKSTGVRMLLMETSGRRCDGQ